jgi:hypothetical protein
MLLRGAPHDRSDLCHLYLIGYCTNVTEHYNWK